MEKIKFYVLGDSISETQDETITHIDENDIFSAVLVTEGSLFIVPSEIAEKYGIKDGDELSSVAKRLQDLPDSEFSDEDYEEFEELFESPYDTLKEESATGDRLYKIDDLDAETLYYDSSCKGFILGKNISASGRYLSHWDAHNWVYPEVVREVEIEAEHLGNDSESTSHTENWRAKNGKEFKIFCSRYQGTFDILVEDEGVALGDLED